MEALEVEELFNGCHHNRPDVDHVHKQVDFFGAAEHFKATQN
jgi:hypothetical protein